MQTDGYGYKSNNEAYIINRMSYGLKWENIYLIAACMLKETITTYTKVPNLIIIVILSNTIKCVFGFWWSRNIINLHSNLGLMVSKSFNIDVYVVGESPDPSVPKGKKNRYQICSL